MQKRKQRYKKAWVVAVDMGYGHQRAAFPLKHFAFRGVLNANDYPNIPALDRSRWNSGQRFYETVSRWKHLPLVGDALFSLMDYFQRIDQFYPRRDLSQPTAQLRQFFWMIRHGWGKDLIQRLNTHALPLITTFFLPAYFAEEHGFQGDIYLVICDADISRSWVSLLPKKSRIQYLVPNPRVRDRLQLYGVAAERIFVTGFPLPQENIQRRSGDIHVLKSDLARRICTLDPFGVYRRKYQSTLESYFGNYCLRSSSRVPTLTFAVGGAGAQRELGRTICFSLRKPLRAGRILLNLVAGTRRDVYHFFIQSIRHAGLSSCLHRNVHVLFKESKEEYFHAFHKLLRNTDILWTKPSELVFYAGLGIPIIMAPPIGSQEEFNKMWLQSIGAGIAALNPLYTHEWLFDWIHSGWLAEAAMHGFLDASHDGVENIRKIVLSGVRSEIQEVHLW